nr:MAG TPA: hypothetical protein [Caudoviricetes sp.]
MFVKTTKKCLNSQIQVGFRPLYRSEIYAHIWRG